MKIYVVNGPNLNLQGVRQPEIYGTAGFPAMMEDLKSRFSSMKWEYFQSNSEGELIDCLHRAGFDSDTAGIILNPGAYAHYSYALADAVGAIPVPVVEVHISNIHSREEFRRESVTAREAAGMICGLGLEGYALAAEYLIDKCNPE